MEVETRERTQNYIHARNQHPAWQLLASRRAPLVISCLESLFEKNHDGIAFDDALQSLADLLAIHANQTEFEIGDEDYIALARKELRSWIKRSLVVEREGTIHATDALEEALRFVGALGDRIMTSTASRLSVVQREIENLEANLNPDPKSRISYIRRKIDELQYELKEVEAGNINVLDQAAAIEGIREIYALAISLRADFRRVEDSWREADRLLRQSIISEQNHRGIIMDKLLDGHDTLLETPEGRVFDSFQQQLSRSIELDNMKHRLRTILRYPAVNVALTPPQSNELRWLTMRLVKESAGVIRARARSERDVKGFLKTGLAADHHRVGEMLNDIFQIALNMDWDSVNVRRNPSPLPPIAIANSGLPLVERLRFKSIGQDAQQELDLSQQVADLNQIDNEFWDSFDGLDRQALFQETLMVLKRIGKSISIAELVTHLPPTHDLETIALWLSMAREAGILLEAPEVVDIVGGDMDLRFYVPKVQLNADALQGIDWEL